MKKRLLTSFIENQKFVICNNLGNVNTKKFPFNKTTDRFNDTYKKDEIKGTLAVHNRKAMKSSLSLDNLTERNTGVARYTLHKNNSQPLFEVALVVFINVYPY